MVKLKIVNKIMLILFVMIITIIIKLTILYFKIFRVENYGL